MKFAIFCFSGTGNTYFVADTLRKLLSETDVCDLYSVERHLTDADAIIDRYDGIGLGYPTHGSSLPTIVFQFIDGLAVHQKIAFTFCTQWLFSGDGAAYGARQLAKKGFIVLWQAHFMMPNNITDLRILDHKSPYDYSKIATSVHKKAKRLVQAIIDHREQRFGSNVFSLLLGLTQRFPFEKMDRVAFARAVNIKDVWCTRCGICVKLCPTKNLFKDQNKIQTLGNCTLCYRCVNHCPTQAIRLATKQRVKYPYLGPTQAFDIKNLGKDIVLDTITNVQK